MTFVESIKTCLSKYVDFSGRASKSEFWWFALFTFLVGLVLNILGMNMLGLLFNLGVLLPSLAVGARRLHDTDKTGWLQLLWFIPVLGWIAMIYLLVQDAKEPNRFGTAPVLASDTVAG